MNAKITGAAQMLKMIGFTQDEAKKAADMLTDAVIAAKAVPQASTDTRAVMDRWQEGETHAVPSGETLRVGPLQESSGAGAEHMISQYSNPAPQKGVTIEAEHLAAELGSMRGYMKSIADAHNNLAKAFGDNNSIVKNLSEQNRKITLVLAGVLAKAEEEDEEDEEDHEEHAEKAASAFAKAQKLLDKAKKAKESMKAATIPDIKKSLKKQAKYLKKAAINYLVKADAFALFVSDDNPTRKSMTTFFEANPQIKADMEEERDEDEEEQKAKKAKKAMKALLKKAVEGHKDAEGNQADKQKPENGNQDDSAVKALGVKMEQIDNALKGFGMLKTDIAGLIDTVYGKTVTSKVTPLPSMMKSDPLAAVKVLDARIEKAVDEGTLDVLHENAARNVLSKYQAWTAGLMTEGTIKQIVAQSPTIVREIFSEAA